MNPRPTDLSNVLRVRRSTVLSYEPDYVRGNLFKCTHVIYEVTNTLLSNLAPTALLTGKHLTFRA